MALRSLSRLLLVGTLLSLVACNSPRVRTDFDPGFDFGAIQRFEWLLGGGSDRAVAPEVSALDLQRFESAVQKLVVARGYEPQPPGDVVLRAGLASEEEYRSFVNNYGGFGYGYGYGPGYLGSARFGFGPAVMVSRRTRAIFYLDVLEPEAERLVWRGSATVPVSWFDQADPAERQRRIDELAAELLENFPPR